MDAQARRIASWGENVYVKIPVTNTEGESSISLVHSLTKAGVKQTVTALMTLGQVRDVVAALGTGPPSCISVFTGRIADKGRDLVPMTAAAVQMMAVNPKLELIWASPSRVAQYLPCRPGWLPHHHRDPSRIQEALLGR
jgi:transaldolase